MTRTTNARLAGATFFFYIVSSLAGAILFHQASGGDGVAVRLASIAAHAPHMRLVFMLALLTVFEALILAVALYALTREEDRDLALACRVIEGAVNAMMAIAMLALLSVATEMAATLAPDAAASNALGAFLLHFQGWGTTVGAPIIAVGSTLYAYLFLRARSIPAPLAWLGVFSSALLAKVKEDLSQDLEPKGFRIDTISMVGNPRLDPNVVKSINQAIQAQQDAQAAQNKVAQVEAEARQKIAEADGEAQKITKIAEAQAAANEKLTKSLTPQLVQYEALQKWDGHMPQVTGAGGMPFIQLNGGGSK